MAFQERLDSLAASTFRFIPKTEKPKLLQEAYDRVLAGETVDLTGCSSQTGFGFEQEAAEQGRRGSGLEVTRHGVSRYLTSSLGSDG